MISISENKISHWAYNNALEAIKQFGKKQVVCTGWSPSGIYHIGNSREAVTCNAMHLELLEHGSNSKYIFVIDDYDPLDKIPHELKSYSKDLIPYLGHPLVNIPDFTNTFENYSSYFANGPKQALKDWGFDVEFVNASDLYKQGKYDQYLDLYIEYENKLQDLMETITGSRMDSLISITCQNCGNAKTTRITEVTMDKKFIYTCTTDKQYKGCDHEGEMEIASHNWKLKWRLDWPARQQFLGVTIEPSGKDHSVAGGSIDTANEIHKSIFNKQGPMLLRYGFITLKGKKFSGSKGGALAAEEIVKIMPHSAFLYLVYRSDLLKDINFNPQSDEYGTLLDEFDIARRMWRGEIFEGRAREVDKLSTAAFLAMTLKEKETQPAKVKFNELVLIHQSSLRQIENTVSKLQKMDKIPDQTTVSELFDRLPRIERWIDELAPNSIKFTILPENKADIAQYWTKDTKTIWMKALNKMEENFTATDFTSILRELSNEYQFSIKEIYPPFYQMVLGQPRGPNAANLVVALGKNSLFERIESIQIN
ncbi:MAG: lysine--tRNA ligase [Candidatus Heimdallarchaeota archaeon]|nr:lysine--tRNA ligase [Candidatus Heimdallarchaeota archaeon]